MPARFTLQDGRALLGAGIAYFEGEGRGLAASLALHGLFAALIPAMMLHRSAPPMPPSHVVPIDVIRLGAETTSPPAPVKAKIPRPFAPRTVARAPASANKPEGTSPTGTKPLPDDLETKLNSLARLRQPQSNTKPLDTPAAEDAASSNDAAPGQRDGLCGARPHPRPGRAQMEFQRGRAGQPQLHVALRIVVLKNGTVASAEILDRERYTRDALYRDIAPQRPQRGAAVVAADAAGGARFDGQMEVTLNLNPRDALR